jgi:hypothetical protein
MSSVLEADERHPLAGIRNELPGKKGRLIGAFFGGNRDSFWLPESVHFQNLTAFLLHFVF